jgi:hypothetical protein
MSVSIALIPVDVLSFDPFQQILLIINSLFQQHGHGHEAALWTLVAAQVSHLLVQTLGLSPN